LTCKPEHRTREVDTDDMRRRPWASTGFERHVRRPTAHIDKRLSASELERSDRRRAPASIDAGTEEMVEEIVPRGDRIEHPCDAIG
jgi:hypothetical protein